MRMAWMTKANHMRPPSSSRRITEEWGNGGKPDKEINGPRQCVRGVEDVGWLVLVRAHSVPG